MLLFCIIKLDYKNSLFFLYKIKGFKLHKILMISLLTLSIFYNLKSAEANPQVFDEDFGYTNKIFESGQYAGKFFKDVKAEKINPEVLGPNQTSPMPAIACSFFETDMYLYCYKINPQLPESKFYQRLQSINVSRQIIEESGETISRPNNKEGYYIATGENLLNNNPISLMNNETFAAWSELECQKYINLIMKCGPKKFLNSLEQVINNQNSIDIFQIINFARDFEFFKITKIDFNSWKAQLPEHYTQILENEAALRCYYRYLYNLYVLHIDEVKNNLQGNYDDLEDKSESELKKILCPYARYNSHCENGFEEPEDNPIYQRIFGSLKVNKYLLLRG